MKKIVPLSIPFLSLFLLLLQTGITSCTKEKTVYDTVTVTKRDTVIIKDTAISIELLTANSWKIQEIRGVSSNTVLFYQRGGTLNTSNFDNEYITFNSNKSGLYYDATGGTHSITWDFLNADKTKLTFIQSNPAPLGDQTVVYENLRYKNGALLFDQYWSYNGTNQHAQVIRIPK